MTKINYFSHKLLAGAVAFALIALAARATAENIPQFVTVVKVKGEARYSMDNNKTWQKLHQGDVLQPGAVIQTAEKSTVDVVMGESQGDVYASAISSPGSAASGSGAGASADNGPKSNVIRIDESSVLAIDKLTVELTGMDEVSETQFDLRAGKITGNVKKLSAASRYEVKIPNGVAGIRGTTYIVSATGTVYVLTGQVIITYIANGQMYTATVSAGQAFTPFNGTTAGPGTTTTIPPAQLAALINTVPGGAANPKPTPASDYTKNNTLVHISPN